MVPVFDPMLLPIPVPEYPAVRCPEVAPMFREPSTERFEVRNCFDEEILGICNVRASENGEFL